MKEKIEFQSVVAETLLIPLYMAGQGEPAQGRCAARPRSRTAGGPDRVRLRQVRQGLDERIGLRGAQPLLRPTRRVVHPPERTAGGRERRVRARHPVPADRRTAQCRILRVGSARGDGHPRKAAPGTGRRPTTSQVRCSTRSGSKACAHGTPTGISYSYSKGC